MRIGLIAPPWLPVPPSAYGGTESVLDNLARGLSELGHEVVLFTIGTSTVLVARRYFYRAADGPMGLSVPEAAHALAGYESLRDVDVIHDHTVLGPLVAAARRMPGPPRVVTNHGVYDRATLPLFRLISRSASVVAISHDQARRAVGVPVAAVIHHGVDLCAYRPGPGGGGYLAFVGRMAPEKGVDRAVRIARAVEMPLRIVTKMHDPAEVAYFEQAVRPLLAPGDSQPEELGFAERLQVLQYAEALVNPIRWPEPFGLVMAESLAAGTPVVAFREGAAPEIVTDGETGFLCEDEREAACAVRSIPALDRRACRAAAEARFSVGRMARDHAALYESLLASRPVREHRARTDLELAGAAPVPTRPSPP